MVKLIAADMDGTLLNSQKELPPRFFPLLEKLREKGVRFAAASGRQYYSLLDCFPGMENDISFICENGALIFEGGECLFADTLATDALAAIVEAVCRIPGANIVLCGVKSAYVAGGDDEFFRNVSLFYPRCTQLDNLLLAAREDTICKVAVFYAGSAESVLYPALLPFSDRFQVSLSGNSWVDLMNAGVSKGTALVLLEKKYGLGPENCMAFGDYLNDCEMMQACAYSYAMKNAHPALKVVSRFEAGSNDEEGVLRAIEAHFSF